LELRSAPTVRVEARFIDSQNQPRSGTEIIVTGRMGDSAWLGRGSTGPDGKATVKAPQGLGLAHFFVRADEHTALRIQMATDAPSTRQRLLALGTLDHDLRDILIRRYEAPIVLVKVSTLGGGTVAGVRVRADYRESEPDRHVFPTGDLLFEVQPDGRWRTKQMLPDEDIIFTASAEGHHPRSETVRLREGAIGELELVLEPIRAGESKWEPERDPAPVERPGF
jgi:hypothetical protein